ncbi:MAG: endolytic transglycosylase MltG [Gammaproteobacteria bacterium]
MQNPSDPKSEFSYRRRLSLVLALLVVVVIVAAGYTTWRLTTAPLPADAHGVVITVKRGESVDQLAHRLAARGILTHAWDLKVLARVLGDSGRVRAGEYRIGPKMSVAGLLDMLVAGRVLMHSFIIVPGTTFYQVRTQLEADTAFKDDIKGLSSSQIAALIDHPGMSPEGRLLPQTYDFPRGTPDSTVIARAWAAMQQTLQPLWAQRATDLPYTLPKQALTLASIIEKETALASERARIAGVFVRRLRRGMYLGADPTVIYGLGPTFNGDITRADLRGATPYNTYVHRGLPPTPICMPSVASIRAALHPVAGQALYFVAKGDGSHVFSDTLAEQQKMIEKYQLHQGPGSP